MEKNSEIWSLVRTGGVLVGCLAAAFGGMVVRERKSISVNENLPIQSLVASKEGNPIPEDDYFTELAKLLEEDYVDPIDDEMKLAVGAVRGMIGSLNDLHSIFYEKNDFAVVMRSLKGDYEGIGADLAFQYPPKDAKRPDQSIPRVVALSVVPGGPADRAGLKAGDWIDSVDNRWVINTMYLDHIRDVQQRVASKQSPATELEKARKDLRAKLEDAIPPMRAWKRLMIGAEGAVNIKYYRGAELRTVQIRRATSHRTPESGTIRLSFLPGSDQSWTPGDGKTIDLRGAAVGDYKTALGYLAKCGAGGSLGQLSRPGRAAIPVLVKSSGSAKSWRVLVDKDTRGAPEIFALALKKSGATLVGQTGGDPVATEVAALPDGSGFTLNLGAYKGSSK